MVQDSGEAGEHKRLIEEKIERTTERAVTTLSVIREMVRDFLVQEKGYLPGDIETDRVFEIESGGLRESASVDYIITLGGRRLVAIKCSPGALESRERHLISFARIVDAYLIPLAVLSDGLKARILDVQTGKLLSEGLESIPDRSELLGKKDSLPRTSCPPERLEKEKRILLAFESIKCTEESCE